MDIKIAFTSEIRSDAKEIFTNGDDHSSKKNLTSKPIARMAFDSVFSDVLQLETPEERRTKFLQIGY